MTAPKVNPDEGRALLDAMRAEEGVANPHDPRPGAADWAAWARNNAEQLLDMVDDLRIDLDDRIDVAAHESRNHQKTRRSINHLIAAVDVITSRTANDELKGNFREFGRALRAALGEFPDSYTVSPGAPAPLNFGVDYGRHGWKVALVRHRHGEITVTELVADLDTITEERIDGEVQRWTITLTPPKDNR